MLKAFPSFNRLSIDQTIYSLHGLYGIDYPPEKYEDFQTEAKAIFLKDFEQLLQDTKDVILDRSFYAKRDRLEFKAMIEEAGARWVLVYLKATQEVLWKRICERRAKGVDADSALEIRESLLERYISGFEAPTGEGEIVLDVK